MRSINKVIVIGNLTRNPEMRQTPNGQSVTTFGIATNREWATKDGEKKSSAEFHECVAWARLAEICANYLKKGHLVYVEGYLKTRSWDSQEGIKKFKTEIVVQDMIMLEKKKSGEDEDHEDYLPENFDDENSEDNNTLTTTEEVAAEEPTNEDQKTEEKPVEDVPVAEIPAEEPPAEENPIDKDLGL